MIDAWSTVNQQIATSILVIEDEPVIALDIASLVGDLGHQVVGIAASQTEAVALFKKTQPGLDTGRYRSGCRRIGHYRRH